MWKTRTKISKILTNIHAGFVTALLGCVLTFAPLSAMGVTVSSTNCTQVAAANCSSLTAITPSGAQVCTAADMEYICLQSTMNSTQKVRIRACSCGASATDQEIKNNSICGTITLNIPKCTTSGSECTFASDCGTSDMAYTSFGQTGYMKKTTYTCEDGTCGSSTSYTCAFGYGGTASCTARKNPLTGITTYTCSGCEKTCSSDSECTYTYTTTQNLYYITVGQKCRTKSGTTYKTCTNYTKSCGCIKGYYGEPYNNADTGVGCIGACTRCDIDPKTGIYGTTTGDGVGTEAKHCYIPSGEPFTDDIGSGRYSGACYDL